MRVVHSPRWGLALLVSCACAAALLVAGCGGASSPANPGAVTDLAGAGAIAAAPVLSQPAGQVPMPSLPAPSAIGRDASVIESGLVCSGASFRDDLTHQHVTRLEENCLYDPAFTSGDNPLYSEVALAIYSFDTSSLSAADMDVVDLDLDGVRDLVIGTARIFAGVPSIDQHKWEWSELSKKGGGGGGGGGVQIESWSWGASNPGSMSQRAPNGVLNVCVVVFGDTALDVSRVALVLPPSSSSPPVMQELFRKGWDGTVKGSAFVGLDCDDADRVHATCGDSSNGQLYYFQVDGRSSRELCLDCDAPVGSSSSVCVSSKGEVVVAYTDDELHQGLYRWMAPEAVSSMIWSPRSNFATGDDGSGAFSSVGAQCRCVESPDGKLHVFYVDEDNDRVMCSSFQLGALAVEDAVSSVDELASCPAPVRCPDGTCVAYLSRSPGSSVVRLMLATQDAVGAWSSRVLADDVHLPDYLDPDEDCDGFVDAALVPGTDVVVCAYSSPNGFSVVHFDLSSSSVTLRESPTRASTGGAFVRCVAMGDGSVRVCHYDTASRCIYFENGDVPTGDDFVQSCLLQYDDGKDQDCDGFDFWLDPDSDDDGFHQAVVVELSSSISPLGQSKKEFKGHVTLLK